MSGQSGSGSGSGSGNIRKAGVTVLQVLKATAEVAGTFCPPVSFAGAVIGVVLSFVGAGGGDVEEEALRSGFLSVHQELQRLGEQNRLTLERIRKGSADLQFGAVREALEHLYREYVAMVSAPAGQAEARVADFRRSYVRQRGKQHLKTLYESVMGVPKVFSRPVLDVYREYSGNDPDTMRALCQQLLHLLGIGGITYMAYSVIVGDNVEKLRKDWEQKMKEVQHKMEEYQ